MQPTEPATYLPLVHFAQEIVAGDLLDYAKATGLPLDAGGKTPLARLALSDLYETLLARAAGDVVSAPTCPGHLESAYRQFVLKHLQAILLTWLLGATQEASSRRAVNVALERLGMPTSST